MSSIVLSGNTSGSITVSVPDVAGTNTVTIPAVTGTCMVSGNMPAFSVTNSGNQTVTAGVSTKVTLDSEAFDTNNNFASSRFTPTVAGYYQINGGVYCPSVTRVLAVLNKNASTVCYGTDLSTSTGEQRSRLSTLVYMNGSTDYLELYVLPFGGTTVGSQFENTYLNGSLVRAA